MKKVIAIVTILLIIVGVIYLNTYTSVRTFDMDGYIFTSDNITKNLINGEENTKTSVNYSKVKFNDLLYANRGKYYIGKTKKQLANTDYPIVSTNSNTLLVLSDKGKLVDSSYRKTKSYANTFISDNKLFNENDYERADNITYLFMELDNSIFVNLSEMKIETTKEYVIPVNSFVAFSEDSLRYYYLVNGKYLYKEIGGIDNTDKISLNGKTYKYEKFLERLGLFTPEEKVPEMDIAPVIEDEEEPVQEEVVEDNTQVGDDTSTETKERAYVKPNITFGDAKGSVYSVTGKLEISDPTGQIVKYPTFEFWKGKTLVMRKTFSLSDTIEVKGLYPDTEYEVIGTFNYKNENNQEVKSEFTRFNVSTNDISGLEVFDFAIESIDFGANYAEFKNIGINNKEKDEILKGVKKIIIHVGNNTYQLGQTFVNKMLKLERQDYTTAKNLTSNTTYDVSVEVIDNAGNVLKTTNKTYQFKTSKQAPTGTLAVKSTDIGKAVIAFDIINKDSINIVNQRYEVYNPDKTLVKSGSVNSSTVVLDELDANEIYTVYLYADWDLEDGKGIRKDQLLVDGRFTTKPISTLGYVKVNVTDVVTTTDRVDYKININDDTNAILRGLLTSMEISLYDSVDNSSVGDPIVLEGEEFERFINGEAISIASDGLSSNHSYYLEMKSYVVLGTKVHEIKTNFDVGEILTIKEEAVVYVLNEFSTKNMFNFDVQVHDKDGAIQSDRVILEVRNASGVLVYYHEFGVNEEYYNVSIDKLEENAVYSFYYIVEEYNTGHTNKTFKTDYTLHFDQVQTVDGLSGSVVLESLLKQVTSKNFFDITNTRRWKSGGNRDVPRRKTDLDNNTVSLSAKNGYRTYSYYLPEYKNQSVKVSFKIKYADDNSKPVYICPRGVNNCADYGISGINKNDYISYERTFTINSGSPYVSFTIRETLGENNVTTIILQDLQIQAGPGTDGYAPYREKPNYLGTFKVNMIDKNHEVSEDDFHYYLRYYKDNELVGEKEYDFNDDYQVIDAIYNYEIVPLANYNVKLSVRKQIVGIEGQNLRYYDIANLNFDSDDEIRTIKNYDEFLAIHTSGFYLVAGDIDYRGKSGAITETFNGIIDFQGHKVLRNNSGGGSRMFERIGANGVLKNMDLHIYFDGGTRSDWYSIATYHFGRIENIMVTLEEGNNRGNMAIDLVVLYNYGIIKNFVINCKASFSAERNSALVVYNNYGTIMNGYIYGEPINATFINNNENDIKRVGVVARYCEQNSYIANVFSLVDIDLPEGYGTTYRQREVGNITTQIDRTIIRNVYTYSEGANRSTSYDINIYSGSVNAKNLYYAIPNDYKGNPSNKVSPNTLRQVSFQNMLNEDNAFDVENYVKYGYYPHLIWPDVMPNQEYIPLPMVDNGDVDYLNVEDIKYLENKQVEATLVFQNVGYDEIVGLSFNNGLVADIISQENAANKSRVKVILSVGSGGKYYSKYSLTRIKHTTSSGMAAPDVNYAVGKRYLEVDMYDDINNMTEFRKIVSDKKTDQNFKMQTDLDFINDNFIFSSFSGKLDGNGHTFKNIRRTDTNFIVGLSGTIKNLFVDNYVNNGNSGRGGFINNISYGSTIDNVHLTNVLISARSDNVGGLVGYTNGGMISNCSVSDIEIAENDKNNVRDYGEYGGLIGQNNNTIVRNSYVRGLKMYILNVTRTGGLGGIIGKHNSGYLQDSYADGYIRTNQQEVGGLVGYNSAYINRVISNVDIYTQQDSVGGIVGYSTNDNVNNTLVLSNVYTSKNALNLNRTIGNRAALNYNFATESQKVNGLITRSTNGEVLISLDELKLPSGYEVLINLGDQFDYSKLETTKGHNLIPKIKNYDTGEVLPNQKNIEFYLDSFQVKEINVVPVTLEENRIQVYITNPENLVVKDLSIDGLNIVSVDKNITSDGETLYEVYTTPERYYDSYLIDNITYVKEGRDVSYNPSAKINLTLYRNISTIAHWSQIEKDIYENYRLIGDIDFTGVSASNIKTRVSFNRLEGLSGNNYTIKGIHFTASSGDVGLIDTVASNIQNVTFEDIKIDSTSGRGFTGIIRFLNGTMYDVNFNDIRVKSGGADVGAIGYNQSPDIKNININGAEVRGTTRIGGFIGRSRNFDITHVTGTNLTVIGSGERVGGLIGEQGHTGDVTMYNFSVDTATVQGTYYVGGIQGLGGCQYAKANNVHVSGKGYIGGLSGEAYNNYVYNGYVTNSEISGSGYDIGGAYGYSRQVGYVFVDHTIVTGTGTDTTRVGGLVGRGGWTRYECGVSNSTITNNGTYTGGLIGRLDTGGMRSSYVYNTTVTGRLHVGGMVGVHSSSSNSTIYYCLSNATVHADEDYAGGIMGHLNNSNTTDGTNRIYIYHNLVAGSNISSAGAHAGSIAGYTAKYPYSGHFYNNFIVADVYNNKGMYGDKGQFFIGNNGEPMSGINDTDHLGNTRVYEDSTFNGQSIRGYSYPSNIHPYSLSSLSTIATFKDLLSGSYYSYVAGKYPYLNYSWGGSQVYKIDLPTAPSGSVVAATMPKNNSYGFPDVKVYVSDVDKINVEFSKVDPEATFTINKNTMNINQLTYTYYYDFADDFEIVLNKGPNNKKIVISAKDLREYSSVDGNDYYFINGEKVESNNSSSIKNMSSKDGYKAIKLADNEKSVPVNIYNNKVLLSDKNIYDLEAKKTIENHFENLTLVENKPLYSYNYGNNKIDTYYNYSIINGEAVSKQVFVKDDNIEVVDSTLSNVKNSVLVDQYNGKNYLIYLGVDGKLYSLKDDIVFPKKFTNSNIKSISTDMYGDSDIVFVLYNNMDYIVFNYRTGKVIKKSISNNTSVEDYFKSYASSTSTSNKNTKGYQDSLKLIDKIEKNSISDVLGVDNSNSSDEIVQDKYASFYNPVTKKYEVYKIPDVASEDNKDALNIVLNESSISNDINNNVVLYKYYLGKDTRKSTILISVALIVVGIFAGIIVAIILLRRNILRKEKQG